MSLCSNGFVELIHHATTSRQIEECRAPAADGQTESAPDQSPASHRGRLRASLKASSNGKWSSRGAAPASTERREDGKDKGDEKNHAPLMGPSPRN
jgi:hypothetical protein